MATMTRARARAFGGQACWYLAAGAVTTAVQAVLFILLRTAVAAHIANLTAIVATTLANTEFHRRFTFVASPDHVGRRYVQTAGTIAFYAASGSLALLTLRAVVTDTEPLLETATLVVTSCVGGVLRFLALRYWVFRP